MPPDPGPLPAAPPLPPPAAVTDGPHPAPEPRTRAGPAAEGGAPERSLRAALEASPDGFMLFGSVRAAAGAPEPGGSPPIVDFEWRYTNPAAERLVRRTHAELLGRRLLVEMPGNREEGLFDAYVQVVESGEPWRREFAYRHEGMDHVFRATAVRVGDGVAVSFSDVTARDRAEAELRATAGRLRFLAEAGRALTASLDPQATLETAVHLAVPRLADAAVVDLVESDGRAHRAIAVHADPSRTAIAREYARRYPPGPANPRSPAAEALRSGAVVFLPQLGGAERRVDPEQFATSEAHRLALVEIGLTSLVALPLLAHDRAIGVLTLATTEGSGRRLEGEDVALAEELARRAAAALDNARLFADAQRARAEAEQANRAKSQFLATMSHELRTPLNAILGYADLLELEVAGPVTPGQRRYLERVRASGRHLLGLIDDVLDFAKTEAGQLEVARERTRLAEVVTAALELVRPQAEARGVSLSTEGTAGDLAFCGDGDRARQVLVNLLSNAVKFTGAGGAIRIVGARLRPAAMAGLADDARPGRPMPPTGWVVLHVHDTGIGIPADQLERIFQPFVQADRGDRSEYARSHPGTGLGLAISRQLARAMEGELTARSEPGAGSTFTLWLPPLPDPAPRPAPLPAAGGATPAAAGHGDRALGRLIVAHVGEIVERFTARLRDDPAAPLARTAAQSDLEDHVATFLADVAQHFTILDEPGVAFLPLLRDGTELQQLLSDRHGAQRRRLGWDESALRREFVVLAEEIERVAVAQGAGEDVLALVRAFLREAAAMSVAGHRAVELPAPTGRPPEGGAAPT